MAVCSARVALTCNGGRSYEYGIPYSLFMNTTATVSAGEQWFQADDNVRFWLHYGLVIIGFILAIITFIVQVCKPAPYGRHSTGDERLLVPARIAYFLTEFVPGIAVFTIAYFLAGECRYDPVNLTLYALFTVHYVHRAMIHPCVTIYSNPRVAVWMPLSTFIANVIYHYTLADFAGSVHYCRSYHYDPRFIIGLVLFVVGFVLNKAADVQLVCVRRSRKDKDYYVPRGPLFCLVSCPNYLGEMLEWMGWALAAWSLAGVVWFLFTAATFIPRSYYNHRWYKTRFGDYPKIRRALIPFIY